MEMPIEGSDTDVTRDISDLEIVSLYSEFDYKVKYPFKRFVFLSPVQGDVDLNSLLNQIFQSSGYEAHKICYHGAKISHIHIKYYEENDAKQAVQLFRYPYNIQGLKVAAIQLHHFLLALYATECQSRRFPAWTLSVVDIEGTAEHCQPLSKDAVRNLLVQFGDPRIFSYNSDHAPPNHVQALFSSMAEALGASIAHGSWMRKDVPESPKFRYRIRLIGSEKESEVMRRFSSCNNVDKIFEMDYFVGSNFVGSNLSDVNAPAVQNYQISEQFNQPQVQIPRGVRNFSQSNYSYLRGQQTFRGRSSRGRYHKSRTVPKQPVSQTVAPNVTKSGSGNATTATANLPEN